MKTVHNNFFDKRNIKFRLFLPISCLIVLLCGLYFFYFQPHRLERQRQSQGWGQKPGGAQDFGGPSQTRKQPRWNGPVPNPPKAKITYYKGLWAGTWFYPEEHSGVRPEPEKYKSWGVNIVNIQPGFEVNSRGETRYPLDYPTYEDLDAWFGQLAELFYKNNIHLAMTVMVHYKEEFVRGADWGGETAYIPKEKAQSPGYFKNYDTIVTDMAKIAEKYHFDLFSPMGEPENVFLDGKIASDWSQQILPKIKKYYKGKVYYKGDLHKGEGEVMNFKGYDVLGMVTTPLSPQAPPENYRKSYGADMDRVNGWAKRDGVPEVVISEYGNLGNQQMESTAHFGIILEEGSNKTNGVFLTEPFPVILKTAHGNQIVEEVKRWFYEK